MKNANPLSRGVSCAALLALASALGACAKEKVATAGAGGGAGQGVAATASGSAGAGAVVAKPATEFFAIKVGDKIVRMQLAVRPEEMQRGLMGRRDLGPDDGMIFVYDAPQQMSFWMRNTPTALDIGFFDASGVLQEVYPLHPFDERTVMSRSAELKFALEMNQGWYAKSGVKPGAKIDLAGLAAALKARGFEAKKFGL